MTVNRTTLLDLPLPVTGTESGTWGDTTNNGLSQYMDIAIAGMNSLTSANFTAGALTLANTLGDSSATNIAAGSAQYATIRVSSLAVNSTITAPGSNRSYRIINADATYSLTIKASGQTGVTFLPGQTGVVAFNGTDYVIVGVVGAGTATDNAVARFDGTTGKLVQNSVVTIADSTGDISGVGQLNATTVDATNIEVTNIKAKDGTAAASIADSTGVISITSNPVLSGGTANGVLYLNGSKVATSGSALTFDGTNLATTGTSTGLRLVASSTDASGSVLQVDTTATAFGRVGGSTTMGYVAGTQSLWTIGGTEQMRLTSTGLGIGTSSPSSALYVKRTSGNAEFNIDYNGTNVGRIVAASNGNLYFGTSVGAGSVVIGNTANADALTLDSSGNLGLGVTPSAWGTGASVKGFQMPGVSLWGYGGTNAYLNANAYYNGTNRIYTSNGYATEYEQSGGNHVWKTAPSGTAGNAITFTQALTLTANRNLLVGTTTENNGNGGLKVNGQFAIATSQAFTASGTVNDTAYYVVCYALSATCTLTLPTPANNTGRLLNIVVQSNQQVVSASSNVTAITNGSLTTSILPATAGKWAQLWCDGTYWNIIATNV